MWKNRIIGYEEVDPEQLLANPRNWRIHPRHQQEALEGVLDEVGWVDDIIVNQRTGFVLDGHLRVALAISKEQKTVPIKYIDVSEDEEMILLATFDPIAAMAVVDQEKMAELLGLIQSDNERVTQCLDEISKTITFPDSKEWGEAFDKIPEEDRAHFQQMTFVLHDSQADIIKEALSLMKKLNNFDGSPNLNSNGNALSAICEIFISLPDYGTS